MGLHVTLVLDFIMCQLLCVHEHFSFPVVTVQAVLHEWLRADRTQSLHFHMHLFACHKRLMIGKQVQVQRGVDCWYMHVYRFI